MEVELDTPDTEQQPKRPYKIQSLGRLVEAGASLLVLYRVASFGVPVVLSERYHGDFGESNVFKKDFFERGGNVDDSCVRGCCSCRRAGQDS